MANFYGATRTNYFKVKSLEDFRAWAAELALEVNERDFEGERLVALFCVEQEDGCLPTFRETELGDVGEDIDYAEEIGALLAEGSVAVIESVGHEKLRYVSGWAMAINHEGDSCFLSLGDIYGKAAELWPGSDAATLASY